MRYGRNKAADGFTLIEVMVVVAILGILAGIAYPSYQEAVRKAKRAEGRAALMQLMKQQERYYSKNNGYIEFSSAAGNANQKLFKWFSGDSAAASAYEIDAVACDGETIRDCVLLTATPGTSKVNASFTDPACGKLMLTSTGVKSASGTSKDCWKWHENPPDHSSHDRILAGGDDGGAV